MADLSSDNRMPPAGCITLFGLPFLLAGGFILMDALGVIPPSGHAYVSRWALGFAGALFFVPGAVISLVGILRWVKPSILDHVMDDLQGKTRTAAGCLTLGGLPFFLIGARIILQALGVLSISGDLYVPRWVFAMGGVAFLAPGAGILVAGIRGLFRPSTLGEKPPPSLIGLIVSIVLTCMAGVSLGVVFFGNPEGFYGGITGSISVIKGRIVFTILGALVALLALMFWVQTLTSILWPRKRGPGGGA